MKSKGERFAAESLFIALILMQQRMIIREEDNSVLCRRTRGSYYKRWHSNCNLTGQGIAHINGQKRNLGSVFCRTFSKGKLAFVNNMVGVFEYEATWKRNNRGKGWEWNGNEIFIVLLLTGLRM